MSDIKLLRSLCKILPNTKESRTIDLGFEKALYITRVTNARYSHVLYLREYTNAFPILCYNSSGYFDFTNKLRIAISDIDDFLESDDFSLILRYGRNIMDENIFSILNKILGPLPFKISDFDALFNLAGI